MQAERDFNQMGGTSTPAQFQGRYGRRATDWFSFDLPVDPSSPMVLVVTYNTDERANRRFAILADGRKIGEEAIARRSPEAREKFFDIEYPIPADIVAGKTKVTVRFEGLEKSETGTVYGIRIVRFIPGKIRV